MDAVKYLFFMSAHFISGSFSADISKRMRTESLDTIELQVAGTRVSIL